MAAKRDLEFNQPRGTWFAHVEGFDVQIGVHTEVRRDKKLNAVRLFTENDYDKTYVRQRQLENAEKHGVIAMRHYNAETNTVGKKTGVFGGEVKMIDGKPFFFILRRLVK